MRQARIVRPRARIVVLRRSYLDGGTQVSRGENVNFWTTPIRRSISLTTRSPISAGVWAGIIRHCRDRSFPTPISHSPARGANCELPHIWTLKNMEGSSSPRSTRLRGNANGKAHIDRYRRRGRDRPDLVGRSDVRVDSHHRLGTRGRLNEWVELAG
jgi:hypothetical protein